MTVITKGIGYIKKIKHRFSDTIKRHTPVYLSPVRRIERVATKKRICAMTFDDGPCRLPANPQKSSEALTLVLAKTLESFDARGTFDVIGDTAGNYPDCVGKEGSVFWGGTHYDHYPDFQKDAEGGAVHCPELIARLLEGGHEITNHTYSHILFGPKTLVYNQRRYLRGLSECTEDLKQLHSYMQSQFGYTMQLARPPHYVDKTRDRFSSYDAFAELGYQYMAASFDGAGWLPGKSYEDEVQAMVTPIDQNLRKNPDYFCGQIIFQKDGFNMCRRSPVADGLPQQLKLLQEYNYRVVTVSELLNESPFLDVYPECSLFDAAKKLLNVGWCIAYRDNTIRKDKIMTRGELAMFAYGCKKSSARIHIISENKKICRDVGVRHPYAAAIAEAIKNGTMTAENGKFFPQTPLSLADLKEFCERYFGKFSHISAQPLTHENVIRILAEISE